MLICIHESSVVWIARDYDDQARAGHRSQGKYQRLTRSQGQYLVGRPKGVAGPLDPPYWSGGAWDPPVAGRPAT